MPIRSRSHELEEESIRRFSDLLPSKWVLRRKAPDYGIDCEIEIFDPDGRATGLSFLVQLRATDNPGRAAEVQLETDELDYYRQLDLPVAVFRYCSRAQSVFWQWASTIGSRTRLGPQQATFTHRFVEAERWTEADATAIRRTLEVRRAIAAYPAGAPILVRFELDRIPVGERYALDRAMDVAIAESHGTLARAVGAPQLVEVRVTPEPTFLAVRIDTLTSVTFDLEAFEAENVVISTLYAMVRLLQLNQLARQAEAVAQLLARLGKAHYNDDLAFGACQALAADLPALVQLAIVNGLHQQTNIFHGLVWMMIVRAAQSPAARLAALETLFTATLDAARVAGPDSEAAAHYSMANVYRGHATLAVALRHYNRARHLRPTYLSAAYFLRGLGGVLFEARRYGAARRAYAAAIDAGDDDPLLKFLLGDACLLSGELARAARRFREAIAHAPDGAFVQEAELKAMTCQWLLENGAVDPLPRRRTEADRAQQPDGRDSADNLRDILARLDGLNPLARYNLGIWYGRCAEHRQAHFNFLLCAFVQPYDETAWANAAISASSFDASLVVKILAVAIKRCGAVAYDKLRADLVAQGVHQPLIDRLDGVALALIEEAHNVPEEGFTLRLLDGDAVETMTISGFGA